MPKSFTYEEVKNMVEKDGYKLLSEFYVNTSTHLLLQCGNKHEPYKVTLRNWRKGRRCPHCSHHAPLTYLQVKNEVESVKGYTLISTSYKTTREKMKFGCPNNHEFEMSLDNFRKGARCRHCNGGVRLEYESVKQQIESVGYKLISMSYKNSGEKLHLKCPNNHDYHVSFNNFINQNNRCTDCKQSSSKGEIAVATFLKEHNICYFNEYVFKDCRSGNTNRPYPFDFYIPSLNVCIEYDGEQHFKPIRFGGMSKEEAEKRLKETKARDEYKTRYCESNDIKLIRIPYNRYSEVEEILSQLI